MEKLCILFCMLSCVIVVLGQKTCTDTSECQICKDSNDYHAQCISGTCDCQIKSCTAANVTSCPHGAGSGCPPFAKVACKNGMCFCDRS